MSRQGLRGFFLRRGGFPPVHGFARFLGFSAASERDWYQRYQPVKRTADAAALCSRGTERLILKRQEIPHDDPRSRYMFRPSDEKPFLATAAAIERHRHEVIAKCLGVLQGQANLFGGLDYLQVFRNTRPDGEDLWFIEDGEGGAITALLPGDY